MRRPPGAFACTVLQKSSGPLCRCLASVIPEDAVDDRGEVPVPVGDAARVV